VAVGGKFLVSANVVNVALLLNVSIAHAIGTNSFPEEGYAIIRRMWFPTGALQEAEEQVDDICDLVWGV
jgi:hypothetical protein